MSRTRDAGELLSARVPSGFHDALRRLQGHRMARTGGKITHGALLMDLVEKALEQNTEGN